MDFCVTFRPVEGGGRIIAQAPGESPEEAVEEARRVLAADDGYHDTPGEVVSVQPVEA